MDVPAALCVVILRAEGPKNLAVAVALLSFAPGDRRL